MASEGIDGDDLATCGACEQPMLDMNGNRRKVKECAHGCSHCRQTLHSPAMCDHVWFPVVSSNGREFCNKEHLLEFNKECRDFQVVPVQRRACEPDEVPCNAQPTVPVPLPVPAANVASELQARAEKAHIAQSNSGTVGGDGTQADTNGGTGLSGGVSCSELKEGFQGDHDAGNGDGADAGCDGTGVGDAAIETDIPCVPEDDTGKGSGGGGEEPPNLVPETPNPVPEPPNPTPLPSDDQPWVDKPRVGDRIQLNFEEKGES
eukprot:3223146-Pleurochrysis_carterae.AAC.1